MIATYQETWSGKKIFRVSGRYFRLLETVNAVDVQLGRGGQGHDNLNAVQAGAWSRTPTGQPDFDFVAITTGGAEAVKFVIADGEAGYDRLFTAFAQANTLTLPGNVTVGTAEVSALPAASRSRVVFQSDPSNLGMIALGPVGVTVANSPVLLGPGDMWTDEIAASAAWRAIATAAGQVLRVMTAA